MAKKVKHIIADDLYDMALRLVSPKAYSNMKRRDSTNAAKMRIKKKKRKAPIKSGMQAAYEEDQKRMVQRKKRIEAEKRRKRQQTGRTGTGGALR